MSELRDDEGDAAALDRRAFLRRAAVVGSGAFVVPTIITMAPAGAQEIVSPPPEPPTQPPPTEVGGTVTQQPPVQVGGAVVMPQGAAVAGRTELPRTGVEIDALVAAGLAATAGGAALVLWSADSET
jgi:hypothetical protein